MLDDDWDWGQVGELTAAMARGRWPARFSVAGSLWVSFDSSKLLCASMEETNAMAKPLSRLPAQRRLKKAFLWICSTSSPTLWREPDGNPEPCTSWPSDGPMLLAETGNKALVFKDISFWPASPESCLASASASCSFAMLIGLVASDNISISISLCLYVYISI